MSGPEQRLQPGSSSWRSPRPLLRRIKRLRRRSNSVSAAAVAVPECVDWRLGCSSCSACALFRLPVAFDAVRALLQSVDPKPATERSDVLRFQSVIDLFQTRLQISLLPLDISQLLPTQRSLLGRDSRSRSTKCAATLPLTILLVACRLATSASADRLRLRIFISFRRSRKSVVEVFAFVSSAGADNLRLRFARRRAADALTAAAALRGDSIENAPRSKTATAIITKPIDFASSLHSPSLTSELMMPQSIGRCSHQPPYLKTNIHSANGLR